MTEDPGIVRHRFATRGTPAVDAVAALPGVLAARIDGDGLAVTYDVRQVSLAAIEKAAGPVLALGALRRAWLSFTEANLRASLTAKPKPCCSQPLK